MDYRCHRIDRATWEGALRASSVTASMAARNAYESIAYPGSTLERLDADARETLTVGKDGAVPYSALSIADWILWQVGDRDLHLVDEPCTRTIELPEPIVARSWPRTRAARADRIHVDRDPDRGRVDVWSAHEYGMAPSSKVLVIGRGGYDTIWLRGQLYEPVVDERALPKHAQRDIV